MTGAGGSIGSAAARRCAEQGANLVLTDIREDALEQSAQAARKAGAEVLSLVSDTRSEQDKDFWTRCLELELTGQWLPIRAALPTMVKQKSGSVLVSSSMTANTAYRHIAAYSAAKGGLQSLMKTLMVEFGDDNIRFNSLAIGSTEGRHIIASNAMRAGISYEEAERVVDQSKVARDFIFPLGRMGTPEDIAPAVEFFASDDSAWVTGTTFFVDGGLTSAGMAGLHRFDASQWGTFARTMLAD